MHAIALDWSQVISRVPDAARVIPARTRYTASTVNKWLQAITKPSGDSVITLMATFPEVSDAILQATGRADTTQLSAVERRKLMEARELLKILGEE